MTLFPGGGPKLSLVHINRRSINLWTSMEEEEQLGYVSLVVPVEINCHIILTLSETVTVLPFPVSPSRTTGRFTSSISLRNHAVLYKINCFI